MLYSAGTNAVTMTCRVPDMPVTKNTWKLKDWTMEYQYVNEWVLITDYEDWTVEYN